MKKRILPSLGLLIALWLSMFGTAYGHPGGGSCNLLNGFSCPANHVCMIAFGQCRHNPGDTGDICGVADPCDSSNYCNGGTCASRGASGSSCTGLNGTQGTCQSGRNCISGTCRDGADGDACIGALGVNGTQGTCNSGNICVDSVCRDGAEGDACIPDIGINNSRGTCNDGLLCRDNVCADRDEADEACTGIGQGSCDDGLICDGGTGTCRNVPSQEGQACGIGVGCADDLFCDDTIGGRCQPIAESTESCNALVGNASCAGSLVCDLFTSECRQDPPVKGEVCHLTTGACASPYYCNAGTGRCDDRHEVGDNCSGIGVGTCESGLICDGGTGQCRNQPPILGQPCGLGVPCSGDYYCNAGTCDNRIAVDNVCTGIGQGTCEAGLICDGGGGRCRNNPPTQNQPCSIFVPCESGLYCDGANGCQPEHKVGDSCTGLFQGSCSDGLICDGGTGKCRNNPPTLGQACGITVPCADGLYCPLNGLCEEQLSEGSFCTDSSQCDSDLFCDGFSCQDAGTVGDSCTGLFRGSCEEGLICDGGSGKCRNDPPQNGDACGILVDCVASDYCDNGTCTTRRDTGESCSGLGRGTCQAGNLCQSGVCVAEGGVGDGCTGLFRGTCQSGLYCSGNVCVNDPPVEGQNCGFLGICSANTYCEISTGKCEARTRAGDPCDGTFDTSCVAGSFCTRSYEIDSDSTGYRCFPDAIGRLNREECLSLFNEDHWRNAQSNNETFTIDTSKFGGIGVSGSYEIGIFYGENGEFGCYETTCLGAETDIFIGTGTCIGSTTQDYLAGDFWMTTYSGGEVVGATLGVVYPEFGAVNVTGAVNCLTVAAGASPVPASFGGYQCNTRADYYDIDSNDDGINDNIARSFSLVSNDPDQDSDDDGTPDFVEMNGDFESPPDSDNDGLIDAAEPGGSALSAQIASGLLLENGDRITIETAEGEILSDIRLLEVQPDPNIENAPYGMIHLSTTIPVTGEHLLRLKLDNPITPPVDLFLYLPDGSHVEVGSVYWQLADDNTIEITMSDGTVGLDSDETMNGRFTSSFVIVVLDPPAPEEPVEEEDEETGSGDDSGTIDESGEDEDSSSGSGTVGTFLVLLLLLLRIISLTRRRKLS